MKRYVCLFHVVAGNVDHALALGRGVVGGRGPDLTVMEADDREDLSTLVDSLAMSGQVEARDMRFSSEVSCAGWICRIEFDARAELGAVSFITEREQRTEASMVLPAEHMRDLLMGIGAFPYELIREIAERGSRVSRG